MQVALDRISQIYEEGLASKERSNEHTARCLGGSKTEFYERGASS